MGQKPRIEVPRDKLADFCRRNNVRKLAFFGSVLRDDFQPTSDVDVLVDLSKAKITHPGRKIRITLDVPESLTRKIDALRERIGVDRGALIKVWLHERVAQEKT